MNSSPRATDHPNTDRLNADRSIGDRSIGNRPNSNRGRFDTAPLRIATLLPLFAAVALFEAKNLSALTALSNSDVWLHLRTGTWMLQNHAVPQTGLFSQSPDFRWTASTWGYDLLVAVAFRMLDLRSIPVLVMIFKSALAVVTYLLAGGVRGRFWTAVALSATVQYILGGVLPGPTYCSMLLFAVELLLLNQSRATDSVRPLFWLPPLFLLWANLDNQFVFGLLLLLLFLLASNILASNIPNLASPLGSSSKIPLAHRQSTLSPKNAGAVALLCAVATIITPHFYHLYGVFVASFTSAAKRYLPDFHAMGFRQPQDYVLMLLAMAAFLALGLRRSRDPYQISLMIGCTMLSFHAQRDAWLVALAAIAVIAGAVGHPTQTASAEPQHKRNRQLFLAAGMSLAILMFAAAFEIPRSHEALLAKVAQTYPVGACGYIREHQLPQPLFNAYEWGGFLTWYLPEYPVAIDGRAGLYDDDFVVQYSKAMSADVPYTAYPAMAQAGTLLLQRNSLMGEALSAVPAFRVAYSDRVAVVLTRP